LDMQLIMRAIATLCGTLRPNGYTQQEILSG
jgi:hypothetical protein